MAGEQAAGAGAGRAARAGAVVVVVVHVDTRAIDVAMTAGSRAAIAIMLVACAGPTPTPTPVPTPRPSATTTPSPSASTSTSASDDAGHGGDGRAVDAGSEIACVEGVDAGIIDVTIKKEKGAIFLDVPALRIHLQLEGLVVPVYCRAQIYAAAQKVILTCAHSESGATFVARVDRTRLVIEESSGSYEGTLGPKEMREPVTLPCKAKVVFHPFTWRDPKWMRFGSACSSRCFDKEEDCKSPCHEKMTGVDGELTDQGSACAAACSDAVTKCIARCPP